ncbi:phosphonoacetaldehyde hydrolase [Spartinivicinus ruber]|uniref:phosphonoacetaldehyde hydrolase n=1 Tax=Spartinivicinus ruber TaxID=2683272 RepID=UPI0013D1A955|nr:phosphonoacetaldehyde hydrolase [Spartinivicinus ruber]
MQEQPKSYSNQRKYIGKVQGVIFDLAGTLIDFGAMAPVKALQATFADHQLDLPESLVRQLNTADYQQQIKQLLDDPAITEAWSKEHGRLPSHEDIEKLHEKFILHQMKAILSHAELTPGTTELVKQLTKQGIKLGINTEYSRSLVADLLPELQNQGVTFTSIVCANEVSRNRPCPQMSLKNAIELDVGHIHACVKVDDSEAGIEEGLNAGMWTVAVAISGCKLGKSWEEWQALDNTEQDALRSSATIQLYRAGAHYVIDTIKDLPACLTDIEQRLKRGEKP